MNIAAYGGGTNSTAMLIGMYRRNIPIDLILFADTGCEQPHTYNFLPVMDQWLAARGLPQITRVVYTDKNGDRLTLEQECLRSRTLPSLAYGYKKCSLKHKIGPQDKFCNHYPPCQAVWAVPGRNGGGTTPPCMTSKTGSTKRSIRSLTGAGGGRNVSPLSNRRDCRCRASPPVFSALV